MPFFACEAGHAVIERRGENEGEGTEQRQVGVTDNPLGEVQIPVDPACSLKRSLGAGNKIKHARGDGEAQRQVGGNLAPLAPHSHEEVGQNGQDWHEKKD